MSYNPRRIIIVKNEDLTIRLDCTTESSRAIHSWRSQRGSGHRLRLLMHLSPDQPPAGDD